MQMNSEEKVVFSAGNPWIICRSKSHSGRIYYFNTLTGEAAWNLSASEIEKAKVTTRNLTKQDSINIEACPEPKEPPMDLNGPKNVPRSSSHNSSQTSIVNKQIINNKYSKPSYPISPFIVPPFNQLLPNSVNAFMPLAINTENSEYNPTVWAVQPAHQIFINPTIPSLVNQGQSTSANVAYATQVTLNNTTTSKGYTHFQPKGFNYTPKKKFQSPQFSSPYLNRKWENINRYKERNYSYQKNLKKNFRVNDLRQVLSAKKRERRRSYSFESNTGVKIEDNPESFEVEDLPGYKSENEGGYKSENEGNSDRRRSKEPLKEKYEANDADNDWLEENIIVGNGVIKLNVSNLKKLIKPEMNHDCWYIVADKDILLSHLNFLNILCNSDEECCLGVAQQVMADLKEVSQDSARRSAPQAARALAFIRQHLDEEYVRIVDGTCGENITRCDYILNCCSILSEGIHLVILLSNDDGFEAYKNKSSTPIFNVKEMKQFLAKSEPRNQQEILEQIPAQTEKIDRLKPPPLCKIKSPQPSSSLPIKITVNNDLIQKNYEHLSCNVDEETSLGGEAVTFLNYYFTARDGNETVTSKENISERHINRTAVQTEGEPLVSNDSSLLANANKVKHEKKEANKSATSTQCGKKEIRLNRSVSVKSSASNENLSGQQNKRPRWRLNRHNSSTTKNEVNMAPVNSTPVDENCRVDNQSSKINKENYVVVQCLPHDKTEESLSSETSSLFITKNLSNNTMIVEETSTSGIISNSTSNADSESESGKKRGCKFNFKQPEERPQSFMFKITDKVMEDSLRTMIDEWVSRFFNIMEHVLTQVLQKDKQFLHDFVYKFHGGGPWNIRESSDCIKVKFIDNSDIVEAANKLTNIFMQITNHTGLIKAKLEPSAYMEMYTVGVNLVSGLKRAGQGCEDARGAERLLAALLADIRSPNLAGHDAFDDSHDASYNSHDARHYTNDNAIGNDSYDASQLAGHANHEVVGDAGHDSHNEVHDAFKDTSVPDKSTENVQSCIPLTQSPKSVGKPVEYTTPIKRKTSKSTEATRSPSSAEKRNTSYNLRSKVFDRSLTQDFKFSENKNEENLTVPRSSIRSETQDSFFSHLNLVKKPAESSPKVNKNKKTVSPTLINEPEATSRSQSFRRSISNRDSNEGSQKTKEKASNSQPTALGPFTTRPEYEMNCNKSAERPHLDMDELDYSASCEDDASYMNEEYYSKSDYYENGQDFQVNDFNLPAISKESLRCEGHINNKDNFSENSPVDQTSDLRTEFDDRFSHESPLNVNKNLNNIFGFLIKRVKETFVNIETFCKETYKELNEPRVHTITRKYELNEKAEITQVQLDGLRECLNSIIYRETYQPEENIQSLLRNMGMNDFNLKDNQLSSYRDVVGVCFEQANILSKSIEIIVAILKKKPSE